jgi:hypothetical protein
LLFRVCVPCVWAMRIVGGVSLREDAVSLFKGIVCVCLLDHILWD